MNTQHEILIVKPTYRDDWLIPGGMIEEQESPCAACIREVHEEIGLHLPIMHLLCVEYKSQDGNKSESLQFIFDGGVLQPKDIRMIRLPADEIAQYAFLPHEAALEKVNHKLGRRITVALRALEQHRTLYMEDGTIDQ
ncbi:MAG: NUDIX hydrolase [Chloroflexi bacterium]|nr:NUDIX hydrolase [Chloroflexota bacterium]